MKLVDVIVMKMENSVTLAELEKNYTEGCNRCCNSGYCIRCDQCPVEPSHDRMVNIVKLMEKIGKIGK